MITGGGVSSSIDLGLYICEKLAGNAAKNAMQTQMDYPYQAAPPGSGLFDSRAQGGDVLFKVFGQAPRLV